MAQQVGQKPKVQLNKGLITETSELNFPEGASVDELNCSLLRDGSRRRRLGFEYETGFSTDATATVTDGDVTSIHTWKNAGGSVGINLIVVQMGGTLHFYTESTAAISANKRSFTQALSTFERPTGSAATEKIQVTSLQGYLIVTSPEIDSFYINYDDALGTITSTKIDFRIRDYEWLGDNTTYSDELATGATIVELRREYDTRNAGWRAEIATTSGDAAYNTWVAARSTYPPLNLPWYSNKTAAGAFSVTDFLEIGQGSSLIANGSYVYDLYDMDRQTKSGIASIENYTEATRFKACSTFQSRVFYAGMTSTKWGSTVFFTRVINQTEDFGEVLQRNDPTAESFSDLLADDGGYITIPEAFNIKRLHVLGSQILVFAENGVWSIRGIDDAFDATVYSVRKLSEDGIAYDGSFLVAESGRPYWWSTSGIHTMTASVEAQTLTEENISLPTIQTFFEAIDAGKKGQVTAAYDAFNRRLAWFFPSNDETIDYKLTRALWFDEQIGAFYPWTIAEDTADKYIIQPYYSEGLSTSTQDLDVITSDGDAVIDSSSDIVITSRTGAAFSSSSLVFLTRTDVATDRVTFGKFTNTNFLDWEAANYSSFMETEYEFGGDLAKRKSFMYLHTFCKVTEDTITGNDVDGYDYTRPSSLLVSPFWDFRTSASQTAVEAYRLKNLPIPTGIGSLPPPRTVTVSRLRVKGRGRSMRLKFESSQGKDFHLLGYDLIVGSNPRP